MMRIAIALMFCAILALAQVPAEQKITKGDVTISVQKIDNTVYQPMSRVSIDCSDPYVVAFKITVVSDAGPQKPYVVAYPEPPAPFISRTVAVDVVGAPFQIRSIVVEKAKASGSQSF